MHKHTQTLKLGSIFLLSLLHIACAPQQAESNLAQQPAAADIPAAAVTPAPQPLPAPVPERAAPVVNPVVCASCGVVRSVVAVSQPGTGTGVGAALGAIVGGVAGNQVGGGSGRKLATVAGAIGGAVVGNNIEKSRSGSQYYEITVDMEGGGQRFITVPDASGISVGAAVELQGSNIYLR
jgi:outer membrane lipoprotein SlyB